MTAPDDPMPTAPATTSQLRWSLCLATLNRMDALRVCLDCALAQTGRPDALVIVDASDDWQANAQITAGMLAGTGIELCHVPAQMRSTASQRNQALDLAQTDICFLIDDDSFMHPDCAEQITRLFEDPACQDVVAIRAADGPPPARVGDGGARKDVGARDSAPVAGKCSALSRFLWRHVLLMGADIMFVPHVAPYQRTRPQSIRDSGLNIRSVPLIAGYKMTVRRKVAAAMRFNPHLLSYSPGEDVDLTHRMAQVGYLAAAPDARLYHHEVASSRIKRKTATQLSLTNLAFFIRQNATHRGRATGRYAVLVLRRILAETIKDAGSRRWDFVQLRGVLASIPTAIQIITRDGDTLAEWYGRKQLQILAQGRPALHTHRPA